MTWNPACSAIEPLYADDTLLVFDKPSGLLAVPGRGPDKQDCLAARVQARYPDALVVHRLDMATSGLMVMARGAAVQRALSRAFAAREVGKRYIAVVAGRLDAPPQDWGVPENWGIIDLPIIVDWPNRPLRIVDHTRGKPSLTRWRVLGNDDETGASTRIELEPVTGRSHQLRVHLRELGHPILGDMLYAPPEVQALSGRLLLHAWSLGFVHPLSGQRLAFECPAPF
ncbi:MAG: RluA family pseudouridine synthase [Gammaproteobacteria bacterium]|nr:RluA family pseudouridine synthase [Gammaproteobacteria bacterium]MBU1407678.1 RluA family pseudouridine synthase [Gammaproteobacteria bacterium]MBU1531791.1 RluA family pseudouridine synthase [Gammaproteobacteria bacterium]